MGSGLEILRLWARIALQLEAAPPALLRCSVAQAGLVSSVQGTRAVYSWMASLLLPIPSLPPCQALRSEPQVHSGFQGGEGRRRLESREEQKAKVSKKFTKGENSFFLLASPLSRSLLVVLGPG